MTGEKKIEDLINGGTLRKRYIARFVRTVRSPDSSG
jgi:hypothetical protein